MPNDTGAWTRLSGSNYMLTRAQISTLPPPERRQQKRHLTHLTLYPVPTVNQTLPTNKKLCIIFITHSRDMHFVRNIMLARHKACIRDHLCTTSFISVGRFVADTNEWTLKIKSLTWMTTTTWKSNKLTFNKDLLGGCMIVLSQIVWRMCIRMGRCRVNVFTHSLWTPARHANWIANWIHRSSQHTIHKMVWYTKLASTHENWIRFPRKTLQIYIQWSRWSMSMMSACATTLCSIYHRYWFITTVALVMSCMLSWRSRRLRKKPWDVYNCIGSSVSSIVSSLSHYLHIDRITNNDSLYHCDHWLCISISPIIILFGNCFFHFFEVFTQL